MSNFYLRLVSILNQKNITIKDATYRLGLKSRTHLHRMFNGNPKWKSIQTVKEVFGFSRKEMIYWLLGDD